MTRRRHVIYEHKSSGFLRIYNEKPSYANRVRPRMLSPSPPGRHRDNRIHPLCRYRLPTASGYLAGRNRSRPVSFLILQSRLRVRHLQSPSSTKRPTLRGARRFPDLGMATTDHARAQVLRVAISPRACVVQRQRLAAYPAVSQKQASALFVGCLPPSQSSIALPESRNRRL